MPGHLGGRSEHSHAELSLLTVRQWTVADGGREREREREGERGREGEADLVLEVQSGSFLTEILHHVQMAVSGCPVEGTVSLLNGAKE